MSQERSIPGCPWAFADDMRGIIDKKEFSDVKFIVGANRKVVRANKAILMARCEVFKAMLLDQKDSIARQKPDQQDVPLVLADVTPEVFMNLLEFLYTNTCTLNSKNVMDVMGCAMEYNLEQLQRICEQYIGETLAVDTASEAMQIAVTYGQEELRERCLDFIEENTESVFRTKGFHELSEEALALLLQSDKLMMDELEILAAVREWATVNSVVLSKSMAEVVQNVIKYVRLALLTPEELKQIEQDNEKDRMVPIKQISEAWKYHALRKSPRHNASVPRPRPRRGTKPREMYTEIQ
ncbi:BTB/POZ domain-containing protein 19-like [Acropora muricata]|uniref:BTB/POZ domain-containing protein 19-like n=1 Tax=Acropora millepora TaxID=45264 RepID=UPI0010FCBF74|nr:BTB/POZ domain-containing protein 19-like [Acropora millepora]